MDLINWIGPSVIIGAIGAIWIWLTTRYLPERQAQKRRELEHKRGQESDRREHLQRSQSDALQQMLNMNSQLVAHLMELNNGRNASIQATLNRVLALLVKMEAQNSITGRDWSRWNEILSDIDLELHEIKTAVKIRREDNGITGD